MKMKKMILAVTALAGAAVLGACSTTVTMEGSENGNTPSVTVQTNIPEKENSTEKESAGNNTVTEGVTPAFEIPEGVEMSYSFEVKNDPETNKEYAVISCEGTDGSSWTYETAKYDVAQSSMIEQLSSPTGAIYINEGGTIKAINAYDGRILWENSNYMGCGSVSTVDENGILYVAGYTNPGLMVLDMEGNELFTMAQFGEYMYPYEMTIDGNLLTIRFDSHDNASVTVNLSDYTYTLQ